MATPTAQAVCVRCGGAGEVRKALRWLRRGAAMRPCPDCRGKLGKILPPR